MKAPPGSRSVTAFCLHYLGGSGKEWQAMAELAGPGIAFVPIDLHGFGEAAAQAGFTVEDMAQLVLQVIRVSGAQDWLLVGHSMGAKIAMAVARYAEDDVPPSGLLALVLIAGSPPCPEPMDEDRREKMKNWFLGDAASNQAEAEYYIGQNIAGALPPPRQDQAVADVLRMNRAAWLAWLDHGSREDWSERIGTLKTSSLLIAGEDDEDLGADAQTCLTLPHLADARLVTLAHTKHLLPLEAPDRIIRLIEDHVAALKNRK